jgi:hypothetical protein
MRQLVTVHSTPGVGAVVGDGLRVTLGAIHRKH